MRRQRGKKSRSMRRCRPVSLWGAHNNVASARANCCRRDRRGIHNALGDGSRTATNATDRRRAIEKIVPGLKRAFPEHRRGRCRVTSLKVNRRLPLELMKSRDSFVGRLRHLARSSRRQHQRPRCSILRAPQG